MYVYIYIYIYISGLVHDEVVRQSPQRQMDSDALAARGNADGWSAVAIFCPFSQFCEINISLLSLQNSPKQPSIYFRRR